MNMSTSNWTIEETHLLIRKRLELFGCARSDKVYDQISSYLAQKHNFYKNAAACQTRFNNLLKTYRTCVKRLDTGGRICKMRFPYFDTFHQYYANIPVGDNASSKCKTEIFLDDIFEDSSYAVDSVGGAGEGDAPVRVAGLDSMMMDSTQTEDEYVESPDNRNEHDGDEELTTSLTVNNGLEDLKLRLMEQKLLYYTNQNMLLQIKQEHYRQKEQERARGQLMAEEILKVLRGIHACLKKSLEVKIVPPAAKKVAEKVAPPVKVEKKPEETKIKEDIMDDEEEAEEEEEEAEGSSSVVPIEVESGEEEEDEDDDEFNGDAQSGSAGSSEEVVKKPEMPRLKVRKNIFPAWNRIQTVLLIKIHCDLRPKFKGFNLFECISNKLIELHINRTPRDCRTRWNNLFRSYKECRSRLRLNDKAVVKFEYFDEIDAYYKDQQFLSI